MTDKSNNFFNEDGSLKSKINAGSFTIAEAKENEDGSINFKFDYDDDFLQYCKIVTGKENPTEEDVSEFILSILEERSRGETDGYQIKKAIPKKPKKFFKKYK